MSAPHPVPASVRRSPAGAPAVYECQVSHTRTSPLVNSFRYRSCLWLVDLDELPNRAWPLRALADFRTADHLQRRPEAGARRTIRQNLQEYLAGEGIDLRGGRVLMLASARVLGYVFNPLSVFWCYDPDGALSCVVAEVHNTYGGRHNYLLRTDSRGRAEVAKGFYVSPFEPADVGRYRLSLPEPTDRLDLTITLHRPGAAPFVAGVRGHRRPGDAGSAAGLLGVFLRFGLAPLVVSARIRWQGIKLVIRGLRVVPRPRT